MDIVTQTKQTYQIEILADSGQTVERAVETETRNQKTVQCELLTEIAQTVLCEVLIDIGQNLEDSRAHSDTKPTGVTV